MTATILDVSLKGDRNYVHGPDIFKAAMEFVFSDLPFRPRTVEFTMHRMTGRQLRLELRGTRPSLGVHDVAVIAVLGEHGQRQWAVLRESELIPTDRIGDMEQSVFDLCEVDINARAVALKSTSDLSWAATVVAMTKLLHSALHPLPRAKQWVLGRLECLDWAACGHARAGLWINMEQSLGTRLTKSRICQGDDVIARIIFAAKDRT